MFKYLLGSQASIVILAEYISWYFYNRTEYNEGQASQSISQVIFGLETTDERLIVISETTADRKNEAINRLTQNFRFVLDWTLIYIYGSLDTYSYCKAQ